jgi:hypothetical protein
VLGTVAWTTVANSLRGAASYRHALAAGFSRGFEVAAGILLLALIVTITTIRVRRVREHARGDESPRGKR